MTEANPSLVKLKRFSRYYEKPQVTTVEELFDELEPFNFLDSALLEKVVKFFLSSDSVVNDLRDYLQDLANFKSSTTVQQFMENIERAQQPHSTTSEKPALCTVKLRLVGGWLTKTMDDLEKLVNEIFKDKTYVLSHLKIVRGSVIVTFCAPLLEAEFIVILLQEQSIFLLKVGVCEIVVGDIMVTQNGAFDFSFGSSLLRAIEDNDMNLLSFLLDINTSPDTADDSGRTALLYGIHYSKDKALPLLLKAKANPNLKLGIGATPLLAVTIQGDSDTVSLLLKANANPDLQASDGTSPLFIASLSGHTEIATLLLRANANPNIQANDGSTPLFNASRSGHTYVVALLLEANANPNVRMGTGVTPLLAASIKGHTDIVSLLLNANANPNLYAHDGTTPLYVISQDGHANTVALLLKANANPNLQRNNVSVAFSYLQRCSK